MFAKRTSLVIGVSVPISTLVLTTATLGCAIDSSQWGKVAECSINMLAYSTSDGWVNGLCDPPDLEEDTVVTDLEKTVFAADDADWDPTTTCGYSATWSSVTWFDGSTGTYDHDLERIMLEATTRPSAAVVKHPVHNQSARLYLSSYAEVNSDGDVTETWINLAQLDADRVDLDPDHGLDDNILAYYEMESTGGPTGGSVADGSDLAGNWRLYLPLDEAASCDELSFTFSLDACYAGAGNDPDHCIVARRSSAMATSRQCMDGEGTFQLAPKQFIDQDGDGVGTAIVRLVQTEGGRTSERANLAFVESRSPLRSQLRVSRHAESPRYLSGEHLVADAWSPAEFPEGATAGSWFALEEVTIEQALEPQEVTMGWTCESLDPALVDTSLPAPYRVRADSVSGLSSMVGLSPGFADVRVQGNSLHISSRGRYADGMTINGTPLANGRISFENVSLYGASASFIFEPGQDEATLVFSDVHVGDAPMDPNLLFTNGRVQLVKPTRNRPTMRIRN